MIEASHRFAWLITAPILLAGCDSAAPEANGVLTMPSEAPTPIVELPAANAPADTIVRLPATGPSPTLLPAPTTAMQPRKDFKDPPLPAELNDDGGLKSLPPRPATHPGG